MISETDSYNVRGHPHADFVRYPTNAVPRTVYKYVSNIKAVENIIQGKIKFASFYELNDASEAATVGDEKAIEQALGELQIKGFSDTQFEKFRLINKFLADANWAQLFDFKDIEEANKFIRGTTETKVIETLSYISEKFKGVMDDNETHSLHYFCLSERYDSLPMWAHYANRGFGFVVVFRDLNLHFKATEPWKFNGMHRVRYHQSRPAITHDPMSLEDLFLTKTIDWQYEKEIRVVKPAKDLEPLIIDENQQLPMKFLQIDAKYISGVIIGHQFPKDKNSELINKFLNIRKDLIIMQANLQPTGQIHLTQRME